MFKAYGISLLASVAIWSACHTACNADMIPSGVDLHIQCSDLFGGFDLSDFLNFNLNLGICSIETAGANTCQKKYLSGNTDIERILGGNFSYHPKCRPSIARVETEDRYLSSIAHNRSITSRVSRLTNPITGKIDFGGGATTLETKEKIAKNALETGGLFSDGLEEQWSSSISSSQEKNDCIKSTAEASMQCDLKKNAQMYDTIAKERDGLIDKETDRTGTNIDLATMEEGMILSPSEEAKQKMPLNRHMPYHALSEDTIRLHAHLRGKLGAINQHRKAMSDLVMFGKTVGSSTTYPSVGIINAQKVDPGVLP